MKHYPRSAYQAVIEARDRALERAQAAQRASLQNSYYRALQVDEHVLAWRRHQWLKLKTEEFGMVPARKVKEI